MRYRRYVTYKNRDGSKTVVSYGPVADYVGGWAKLLVWAFVVALVLGFFLWPVMLATENHLRGAEEWAAGIGGEAVWLGILVFATVAYKNGKTKKTPPPTDKPPDAAAQRQPYPPVAHRRPASSTQGILANDPRPDPVYRPREVFRDGKWQKLGDD